MMLPCGRSLNRMLKRCISFQSKANVLGLSTIGMSFGEVPFRMRAAVWATQSAWICKVVKLATGDPSVVVEPVVNDCEVRHIGQASDGQDIEVENDLYAGGVRLVFKYPKKLAGGQVGC